MAGWPSGLPIGSSWITDGTLVTAETFYPIVTKPVSDSMVALLGDEFWTYPVLTGGWVAFDGGGPSGHQLPAYRKWGERVFLKGLVKNGGAGSGNPVFTLPVGMRPVEQVVRIVMAGGNQTAAVVIDTAGIVQVGVYLGGGTNGLLSLDGIEFVGD